MTFVVARHPLDRLEDVTHRIRRADQIAQRVLSADFLAEDPVLALDVQLLDGALQQVTQHVRVDWLDEVVVRSCVDHFQGARFLVVRAENDHERVDFAAVEPPEQFGAFLHAARRDREAQQQHVEFGFLQELVGSLVVGSFKHFEVRLERRCDLRSQAGIVVDDADFGF